jgi:predicted nucleotidyltransferase
VRREAVEQGRRWLAHRLQRDLSELLSYRVDLHTYRRLSRYFRDEVLEASQPLYERLPLVS